MKLKDFPKYELSGINRHINISRCATQEIRLERLNKIAIQQMRILTGDSGMGLSTTPSIFINFHFTAGKSSTPVSPKRFHSGLPFLIDIRNCFSSLVKDSLIEDTRVAGRNAGHSMLLMSRNLK